MDRTLCFHPAGAWRAGAKELLEMLQHPEQARVVYALCFLAASHSWEVPIIAKDCVCDGCFNSLKVALFSLPTGGTGMLAFQWIFKEPIVLNADCCLGRGNARAPFQPDEQCPSPAVERGTFWLLTWTVRKHESKACEGLKNTPQPQQSLFSI